MLRALGLRKAESSSNLRNPPLEGGDTNVRLVLEEFQAFEQTLNAMDYVLDDQASKAVEILTKNKDSEPIYVLGLGVIEFLEATLGFEPETMRKASATLGEAEHLSYKKKVQNEKIGLRTSSIYPPGTEYAVTYAEANLLNALIMLLTESVIESAKALYKLRKAYHTLDEINKSINYHQQKLRLRRNLSTPNLLPNDSVSTFDGSASDVSVATETVVIQDAASGEKNIVFKGIPVKLTGKQKKDLKILKMAEKVYQLKKGRILGNNIGNGPAKDRQRIEIGFKHYSLSDNSPGSDDEFVDAEEVVDEAAARQFSDEEQHLADSIHEELLAKIDNVTIDEFIHSGVNLCFGILQVVLSLIPPTIGKVLSIVGFKGSRENGLQMLWKATTERNIHGGIATLGLLVFYDGPFQFTDTDFDVPSIANQDEKETSSVQKIQSRALSQTGEPTLLHPGRRLELALLKARAYFPNSVLWLLQEGRMLASQGKLVEAVDLMNSATDGSAKKIEMKQAEALLVFDKAMIMVYLHRYEDAAVQFLHLIDLNSWSHALYCFLAGACYLEAYRMRRIGIIDGIVEDTAGLKKLAEKYLKKAPTYLQNTGKRGFFQSKQMPFDRYVIRKSGHINKCHEQHPDLDFVDCVQTSLIHEISFFWNSFNRMDEANLALALKLLNYSASPGTAYGQETGEKSYSLVEESESELMIRHFLQSLTLRRLGKIQEGCDILDKYVIDDKILTFDDTLATARYIRRTEDPYLYPTALYERGIFCWKIKGLEGIEEVKTWLKKAINYADDYELSARTGMRIKAAMDRLEGY